MTWKDVLKYNVNVPTPPNDRPGSRLVTCPNCNGAGQVESMYSPPGEKPKMETCYVCNGKGAVTEDRAEKIPTRPPQRMGPTASQA